jgi:hypothetical protein
VHPDPDLRALYEHDQEDRRRGGFGAWLLVRDWLRRRRLNRLLAAGALSGAAAEDYFHAAMLLHHAPRLRDYWRAHELAQRAAELGYAPARWLVAASYDRWLMRQGKPQKYGTQYKLAHAWWQVWARGRFRLWEVDPATTDAERAEWGVPPLEVVREWAETLGPGRGRPRLGPTLAVLDVGGLCVEVQDISAVWSVLPARDPPRPAPLAAEQAVGFPRLPAGLAPCRVGDLLGRAGLARALPRLPSPVPAVAGPVPRGARGGARPAGRGRARPLHGPHPGLPTRAAVCRDPRRPAGAAALPERRRRPPGAGVGPGRRPGRY